MDPDRVLPYLQIAVYAVALTTKGVELAGKVAEVIRGNRPQRRKGDPSRYLTARLNQRPPGSE